MKLRSLYRTSLVVIALVVVLYPHAFRGAELSLQGMFNSPVLWIPAHNTSRQQFFKFTDDFKTQDVVIVSWDECSVDDPRLDEFADALERADGGHAGRNDTAFFEQVVTGRSVVRDLERAPLRLSKKAATNRLRGSLIGPNGTSCAIVVLTLRGAVEREASLRMIREVLQSDVGIPPPSYRLGGTPVIGKAIDDESVRALSVLSIPAGVAVFALCWVFLRSWLLILPVLGVAFFGERLALSMVYFTGSNMNAVLVVMSPLVFVLGASAGVHLANYYREEVSLRGIPGSAQRMFSIGWKPCLLSAATTAIGLLSLLVSEIGAVRQFAIFTAISVMVTTIIMLVCLTGILERWSIGQSKSENRRTLGDRWLDGLSTFVSRNALLIVFVCVSLMAVAGWGLQRVRTQVEVFQLLAPANATVQDHQWLEQAVAPLIPVEVIVRFADDCSLRLADRLRTVRAVQAAVVSSESTHGAISSLTFLPAQSNSRSIRATVQRALLDKRFQSERTRLVDLGYLHESGSEQAWRITTRVPAFKDVDYAALLADLQSRIEGVVTESPAASEIRAEVTGVMPVVDSAQQMLLGELVGSLFTALVVITAVVMVGLRSFTLGLVAMIPSVFPLVVLFGVMGWLNQPLDIGAFMTASVALGIAVDDTVHFLASWRHASAQGDSRIASVTGAMRHCGKAITHTTVICGLGLLIFGLSEFEPTQRFAWMMFLLLFAALVGDLLFLPALLIGPLRWVGRTAS